MQTMTPGQIERYKSMYARGPVEIVDSPPTSPLPEHAASMGRYMENAGIEVIRQPTLFRLGRTETDKNISLQPDFYLPGLDLYVHWGSFKNKRSALAMLRLMRPEVRVVLYSPARFHELIERLGDNPTSDELSAVLAEQLHWGRTRLEASFLLKKERPAYKLAHAADTYLGYKQTHGRQTDRDRWERDRWENEGGQ